MTVKELYEHIGANYADVLGRLPSESMIARFVKMFPKDPSFSELKTAFENHDAKTAFRAAHTLKGICLNLSFDSLYKPTYELTEALRGGNMDGTEGLYAAVEQEYNKIIAELEKLD